MSTAMPARPRAAGSMLLVAAAALLGSMTPPAVCASDQLVEPLAGKTIIHHVDSANERLEMVVNSSRILTLDTKIPQAQVNNRQVLEVTPLSPTQIQIFAKQPGVTQVNLWDEEGNVSTVDVIVYGDAQELSLLLRSQFPTASLQVIPLANSVVISGHVDNPDQIARIIEIAEDFHAKVINNISVSGVQQVLLHVKVMEVSRTKLRTLGVDFGAFPRGGDFFAHGVSGVISGMGGATSGGAGFAEAVGSVSTLSGTMMFGVMNSNSAFFGFLAALRQNQLLKIMAEPDLVTLSGRPASFTVGGEFPILVPQSLGTVSIEFKKFGTQVDFVPIVLGNRRIRLEVRPRVSEVDDTRSIQIGDINVPGLRLREVNTGVEMRAGQTLALAGLVQNRIEAEMRGLPWLSDLPVVGTAFRRVREENNEIELLILVTPDFVEGLECEELPPGGPGTMTCSPTDCQLYWKGHLEVPCGTDGRCGMCNECQGPGSGHFLAPQMDPMMPIDQPRVDSPEVIVPAPVEPGEFSEAFFNGASARPAGPQLQDPSTVPSQTASQAPRSGREVQRVPYAGSSRRTDRYHATSTNNPQPGQNQATSKPPSGLIGPVGYDVDN